MAVIATAGHVDHGKSALVRALTGIEPDRWDEERRRGLTIDLGFAWTTLPSGTDLAFVDVPGHQRFIGNMLAGLGPAAAVLLVVAADEGWREQTEEHLLAIDALGIRHGLLVVTRSDLADPAVTMRAARDRIASSSLGAVPAVAVSARTGDGVADVRSALDRLIGSLPPPPGGAARMWLDRAFTIRGAGTVVTGTLGEGGLATGALVELVSAAGVRTPDVRIRGLHSRDLPVTSVDAVSRVAVNVAGVDAGSIGRGGVLLTGSWSLTDVLDVRVTGVRARELPEQLMLHVGTHAAQVRVRPLGDDAARLQLTAALPLREGDRAILRNPGLQHVVAGAEVLDAAPPALRRRGAAAQRGAVLGQGAGSPASLARSTLRERGALRHAELVRLGLDEQEPAGAHRVGEWVVTDDQWSSWAARLRELVTAQRDADPLEPGVTENAAVAGLRLPARALLPALVDDAGAELTGGRVQLVGVRPDLGVASAALDRIERTLTEHPWSAPEQTELEEAGLGPRQLAAAVRLGRIIRLPGDIVLLPDGPARAMRELAALPQPFTTSDARQALRTTRRVAIPLLEHLDSRGWTRRLDGTHRAVVR